jgi:hypothetical protein
MLFLTEFHKNLRFTVIWLSVMQSVFSAAARRTTLTGEVREGTGRVGALKTCWTKPWHAGGSYGDRMARRLTSGGS